MSAKFRLVNDGKRTYAELAGKTIGTGITDLQFKHDANGRLIKVVLELDLDSFEFMPDGKFDEVSQMMQSLPDRRDPAYKDKYREMFMADKSGCQ